MEPPSFRAVFRSLRLGGGPGNGEPDGLSEGQSESASQLDEMVRPARFERATFSSGG